jgi:hypothetical protein
MLDPETALVHSGEISARPKQLQRLRELSTGTDPDRITDAIYEHMQTFAQNARSPAQHLEQQFPERSDPVETAHVRWRGIKTQAFSKHEIAFGLGTLTMYAIAKASDDYAANTHETGRALKLNTPAALLGAHATRNSIQKTKRLDIGAICTYALRAFREARSLIREPYDDQKLFAYYKQKHAERAFAEFVDTDNADRLRTLIDCDVAYAWLDRFGIKLERAYELAKIDDRVAAAYLCFLPTVTNPTGERHIQIDGKTSCIGFDFAADDAMYASILSSMREEQPSQFRGGELIPHGAFHPTQATHNTQTLDNHSSLLSTITQTQNGHKFSPDTERRMQYFVDDLLTDGVAPERVAQFASAFSEFKPIRKMRVREEAPTDRQWRNFFDDVRVTYLRGETVDKHTLDSIYDRVKTET